MKIRCPSCHTKYTIPDNKYTGSKLRANCVKCGARITVRKNDLAGLNNVPAENGKSEKDVDSLKNHGEEANVNRAEQAIEEGSSIAALSPPYPRYRDPLIFAGIVLFLLVVVGSIHFAVRGTERSLKELSGLVDNPIETVTRILMGSQKFDLVESFIAQNRGNLPELGQDLQIIGLEEESGVLGGKKIAVIVAKVAGSRTTGDMVFRLAKRRDTWRVIDVSLQLPNQSEKKLFP